jgi:peroxiredoxin
MNKIIRIMALGLILLFASVSGGQETPLPDRVLKQYSELQNIEATGKLELTLEENGKSRSHGSEFRSWFNENGFRHEMTRQPLLAENNDKTYVYYPDKNVFMVNDVAPGRGIFEKLPSSQRQIIQEQNPSLALAMSKDPKAALTALLGEQINSKDNVMTGVVKRGDLELSATMEVDPQTLLMKRYELDLTKYMAANGREDLKNVKLAVTYDQTLLNSRKIFSLFSPPGNAKRVEMTQLLATGKPAPDFTLEDLEGNKVTLSSLKGQIVVVDFWATWCGPCRAEMPELNRLFQTYKEKGVIVLACNQQEDKETVAKFMKENKLEFTALLDTDKKAADQYNVEGIPTTVLIDKKGLVRASEVGFSGSLEDLTKKIDRLLKGE